MNRKTEAALLRIRALRKRWVLTLLTFGSSLWAMNILLAGGWSAAVRWSWTIAAAIFCLYVLAVLWKALPYNYRLEDGAFLPYFGSGNLVSLLRAWFLAALAGFLIAPLPSGILTWLPGLLYIFNGIADLLDGYLARRAHQVTAMGERLDMSLDGFGVLFASLLLYRYGKLPVWILLVGIARFLFLLVVKLREKQGKPVYDLPPSDLRRALAGVQMGFLGGALLPVFTPPATIWAGAIFSLPFLLHFGRDLLWMAGICHYRMASTLSSRLISAGKHLLLNWLPIVLRLILGVLVSQQLWDWLNSPPSFLSAWTPLGSAQTQYDLMLVFYALGLPSVVLGLVGRGGAALLLIGVGLQQGILPLGWADFITLASASLMLFLGSGLVALWSPEEWLIHHRLGEGRNE
ncbi:MAG: CDP-alcohol phosphatidyltransferase family protein [Anaerolineales bacterium]